MSLMSATLFGSPSGAIISDCGRFRFWLWRDLVWNREAKGTVLFVGLNPSTADATTNDPTIRRMMSFAAGWGYSRLLVGNLAALRSKNPAPLWDSHSLKADENMFHLADMARQADLIVCCWGAQRCVNAHSVVDLLRSYRSLYCLGLTKDGFPKHPLYLPKNTLLQLWLEVMGE